MARHAGVFEVGCGYVDGFRRNVGANDGDGDFAFGAVVVIDFVEKVAVEVWPRFECEVFAEYAGGDVGCYQSRLAQEGAAAAHGVDERGVAAPAAAQYYSCRKHFVDGGFGLRHAVAAFVQ